MSWFNLLIVCSLVAACAPSHGPSLAVSGLTGLGFLPEKAEKGALFKSYQAKGVARWQNNWATKLDLTGVSWNDVRAATLISPSHVVMAAHFARPASVAVMFHDRRGNPHERYITAVQTLNSADVAVARLNLPLPPEVKWYRFAAAADAVVGAPVIVSDQTLSLSVHRIAAIAGSAVSLGYIAGLNPIYQRNLVVGDSGHPSFLVKNGELLLLETHTTGGPGAGPCYADATLQTAVRTAMAQLGN